MTRPAGTAPVVSQHKPRFTKSASRRCHSRLSCRNPPAKVPRVPPDWTSLTACIGSSNHPDATSQAPGAVQPRGTSKQRKLSSALTAHDHALELRESREGNEAGHAQLRMSTTFPGRLQAGSDTVSCGNPLRPRSKEAWPQDLGPPRQHMARQKPSVILLRLEAATFVRTARAPVLQKARSVAW